MLVLGLFWLEIDYKSIIENAIIFDFASRFKLKSLNFGSGWSIWGK